MFLFIFLPLLGLADALHDKARDGDDDKDKGRQEGHDDEDGEGEGEASDAALDPPWAPSRAASAEAEPIFSPIPFLHGAEAAPAEADAAPTQRPAGLAAPGDAEAVYRVPDGRVDELDTAEAPETHGGLADHVAPLSAATSVPDAGPEAGCEAGPGAKRVRSARASDTL